MKCAIARLVAGAVSTMTVAALCVVANPASAQGAQTTATTARTKAPAAKGAAFDATACLGCHAPVKALYDSGKHKGQRHIRGGREEVRACLYMAATSAIEHNAHLRAMAERLTKKGKCFKVTVTAVMRKLIIILNAIVASGQPCQMPNAGRA